MPPRFPAACLIAVVLGAPPASAQFTDATAASGLTRLDTSWGAAMADLDGDGDLDLYAGHHTSLPSLYWNTGGVFSTFLHPQPWSGGTDRHGVLFLPLLSEREDLVVTHGAGGGAGSEPNELYRNDGGGALASLPGASGLDVPLSRARCVSAADYDGDGDPDLWIGNAPRAGAPNHLFRNDGAAGFTDVAAVAGIAEDFGTVGGLWCDFDDDGDPDLLVGGEEFARPTVLWRNDGGVFADASTVFTPPLPVISGADWGDYDNDGDQDLAVCDGDIGLFDTMSQGARLDYFLNTRYGENGVDGITVPSDADTAYASFRLRAVPDPSAVFLGPQAVNPPPVTTIPLHDGYVGAPAFTPGVDLGTYVWRASPGGPWEIRCTSPNLNADTFDGWLVDGTEVTGAVAQDFENAGFRTGGPRVWRNDGGTFTEVTQELGLPSQMLNPRDLSWVDLDNDGDLDLHVVDLGISALPNAPDALFRNDGGTFVDIAAAEGLTGSSAGLGDGGVWGDLDDDGDVDLYLLEGAGPLAFSRFGPATLLRNDGARGPSLRLDLVGADAYGDAIGARVEVVAGGRRVHRRVTANSWRGFQDPRRVHAGLDGAAAADTVRIHWPSGAVTEIVGLAAGRYRIEEAQAVPAPLPGPPPAAAAAPAASWTLSAPRPQPASGRQTLTLTASGAIRADITVHDVVGHRIRTLHRGPLGAGTHLLGWDGRDAHGRRVGTGVYWVRVTDGRTTLARKTVRLR